MAHVLTRRAEGADQAVCALLSEGEHADHRTRDFLGRELVEHRENRCKRGRVTTPAELLDRLEPAPGVAEVAPELGAAERDVRRWRATFGSGALDPIAQ